MTQGRKTRLTAAIAAVSLAGVLAGCSAEESGPSSDPAAAQRASAALAQARSSAEVAGQAERVLTRRCLIDQGFDVFPPDPQAILSDNAQDRPSPPLAQAEQVGYGIEPPVGQPAATGNALTTWDQTTDAYKNELTLAMFGPEGTAVAVEFPNGDVVSTQSEGCQAEVRIAMYGDLEAYTRLGWIASQTASSQTTAVGADPAWRQAATDWRECMVNRNYQGLNYPSDARALVDKAYSDAASSAGGVIPVETLATLQQFQIETATADATCAETAGVNVAWEDATARSLQDYLTEHENDILEWQDLTAQAAMTARQLLEEG